MTSSARWQAVLPTIEAWLPQPWLNTAGCVALALVPAGMLWAALDARSVGGELVALKPTRFALSIGIYLLTVSWMLGYARPDRLLSPLVQGAVGGLMAGAGIELGCIVLQAARGRRSHLNFATPVDTAISGTMLVMAVLFIGMVLPLAWEIARRPRHDAPPLMVWAIVAGLVTTFIVGGLTGSGMGRVTAGAVIPEAVQLPLFGTLRGGSARIAHFLGVHAMQAFPLMAAGTSVFGGRIATVLLVVGALAYTGVTVRLLSRSTPREIAFVPGSITTPLQG